MRSRRSYADPTPAAAMRSISERPFTGRYDAKSDKHRRAVAEYIRLNPGSDIRTIGRALHLSRAAVVEHAMDLALKGGIELV